MDAIPSPATISNLDILDLTNRIDSYLIELDRCQSKDSLETNQHDLKRAGDMVSFFRARFEVYRGQPELDLPKYHPRPLSLPAAPTLADHVNQDVMQAKRLWAALRIEVSHSDSCDRAAGFTVADAGRVVPVLDKIDKHLATVKADPNIDLPDLENQPVETARR